MAVGEVASLSNPAELRRALVCAFRAGDTSTAEYSKILEKYLSDCPLDSAAWRDLLSIALNDGETIAEELGCVLEPMNMFNVITLADTTCKMIEHKERYIEVVEQYVKLADRACEKLIGQYEAEISKRKRMTDNPKLLWFQTQLKFIEDLRADLHK